MRNIWVVNQYAVTPDLPGGTRHYELGVELVRKGFKVTIFASDFHLALRRHTRLAPGERYRIEERDGLRICWLRSAEYRQNDWRRAWNLVSFAWAFHDVASRAVFMDRPDVIVGSSPSPFAALAALRVARRLRAKFVLELRDLWPQALVDLGRFSELHPGIIAMRRIEKHLYRHAERIVVLAKGSEEYLNRQGILSSRVLYIPNGVHLSHFRPVLTREESRRRYGFRRFTAVYAGAHGPANSLETILDAAAQLHEEDVEFVLVGDGPSKPYLLRMAKERGLSNVRFMSPIPKDEVPSLLVGADAGILTLRNAQAFAYAVSPNKLFDYMAAGLPIVCAVPGEVASLVRRAEAGLVCDPEDPGGLAEAVRQLLRMDPHERARMGLGGRDYLAQHHDRAKLAARLANAIIEVAKDARG